MSQIYILESWEEISPLGSWTLTSKGAECGWAEPSSCIIGPCGLSACLLPGEDQASQTSLETQELPSQATLPAGGGEEGECPHGVCKAGLQLHGIETSSMGLLRTWGLCWKALTQKGESHWEGALGR